MSAARVRAPRTSVALMVTVAAGLLAQACYVAHLRDHERDGAVGAPTDAAAAADSSAPDARLELPDAAIMRRCEEGPIPIYITDNIARIESVAVHGDHVAILVSQFERPGVTDEYLLVVTRDGAMLAEPREVPDGSLVFSIGTGFVVTRTFVRSRVTAAELESLDPDGVVLGTYPVAPLVDVRPLPLEDGSTLAVQVTDPRAGGLARTLVRVVPAADGALSIERTALVLPLERTALAIGESRILTRPFDPPHDPIEYALDPATGEVRTRTLGLPFRHLTPIARWDAAHARWLVLLGAIGEHLHDWRPVLFTSSESLESTVELSEYDVVDERGGSDSLGGDVVAHEDAALVVVAGNGPTTWMQVSDTTPMGLRVTTASTDVPPHIDHLSDGRLLVVHARDVGRRQEIVVRCDIPGPL